MSLKNNNNDFFYATRHAQSVESATLILKEVLRHIPIPVRVLDVGCGVGTWLSVAQGMGAVVVKGVDGPWVPQEHLKIDPNCFVSANLQETIPVTDRYDLVISLEVAEHLPPERADSFVKQLCLLGDFILFSAAIPHQEGAEHHNEQWPAYWAERFDRLGYCAQDILRFKFWDDERIPFWYRQNMLLYVKRERLKAGTSLPSLSLSIVHPILYYARLDDIQKIEQYRQSPRICFLWLLVALKKSIVRFVDRIVRG